MRLMILLPVLWTFSMPSLLWAAEKKTSKNPPAAVAAPTPTPTPTPVVEESPLRAGTEETPPDAIPTPAEQDQDEKARFGIGAFYFGGNTLKFKDVDTAIGKQDVDFEIDGASGGVVLSLQYMPTHHLGFLGLLNADLTQRKVKKTTSNGTLTFDAKDDKLNFVTLDFNITYRWEQVYVLAGANVAGVAWKADGSGANVKTRGGVGLQLGVGCMITENIAADLMAKSIGFGFDQDYGGYKTEYKTGVMGGGYADLRYVF